MSTKPKALDLFCGAGGLTEGLRQAGYRVLDVSLPSVRRRRRRDPALSEGLRQAGYRVLGAVELDALACRAYKLNHKRVKLWERDIARISGTEIMDALDV